MAVPRGKWLNPPPFPGKLALISLSDLHRDLYVQALAELQAVDENDTLSYFQIMGQISPSPMCSTLLVSSGRVLTWIMGDRYTWLAIYLI